ncbi:MAG: 50S ribosomal protein L3 [Candidatus Dormibacteraceae bacterium]
MKGLIARKLGMTQLFNDDGSVSAVTVLEAGPCRVLDLRSTEKHGYEAARIVFGEMLARRATKPIAGEFAKADLAPHRHVVEIRGLSGSEVGQELNADLFTVGELVDITATSKGKGFQGVIKRHGFSRGPESHGSMNVRRPGSIGATNAARVFKGVRMAGHMGAAKTTIQGLKVLRVEAARNLLLLRGTVPGPQGGVVVIRSSIKQKVAK